MRILENDYYKSHGWELYGNHGYDGDKEGMGKGTDFEGVVDSGSADDALGMNVRTWYKKTFPHDTIYRNFNPDCTFRDLADVILGRGDTLFRDCVTGDTVVRDRVMMYLSDATGVPIDTIYDCWNQNADRRSDLYGTRDNG